MVHNSDLLRKIVLSSCKDFQSSLNKILAATVEHGAFGMGLLDGLRETLPATECDNCGSCCASVSIFSLEYHRIVLELMKTKDVKLLKNVFASALRLDQRKVSKNKISRIKCCFRDEVSKKCLIHKVRPFACRFFGLPKKGAQEECKSVKHNMGSNYYLEEDFLLSLQIKISRNSESFRPFAQKEQINFFPFEFWVYSQLFSPGICLKIYREVIVPLSTPLQNMWADSANNLSPWSEIDNEN